MKVVVIGSVTSSKVVLEKLVESEIKVAYVFSVDERYSEKISGYYPIHEIAIKNGIPYKKMKRINEKENIEIIKKTEADYIFVVGISQLIAEEIINASKKGTIGFHPTPLPKYRGRAAMVWQVLLGVRETKCTMFFIDKGMDSGDIIGQEPYEIEEADYASDIEKKLLEALERLTDKVLCEMKNGTLKGVAQNEEEATYLLMRTPEDGRIDWSQTAEEIQRLIRAVSRPYPGAFSLYEGKQKVVFWRADWKENKKYIGFSGQIAEVTENAFSVVCNGGLLKVYEFELDDNICLKVGHRFF